MSQSQDNRQVSRSFDALDSTCPIRKELHFSFKSDGSVGSSENTKSSSTPESPNSNNELDLELGEPRPQNRQEHQEDEVQQRRESSARPGIQRASMSITGQPFIVLQRTVSMIFNYNPTTNSLTAQRYRLKRGGIRATLSEISSGEDLSDDLKHRLKGVVCCFVFVLGLAVLLYLMMKPN